MTSMDEKVQTLWDYAVAHPDGFTCHDTERDLGWGGQQLSDVSRHLRLFLADDDINLVATPQGYQEPWLYQLTGNLEQAGPWTRNRLLDSETRLETMHSVSRSLVSSTDGRSLEGRRARVMERSLRRLREDLDELTGRDS